MKQAKKIAMITAGLLLTSIAAYAIFKKQKPADKKLKSTVVADSPEILDESGSATIKQGSAGRYVSQLQEALNSLHKAVVYINTYCGNFWPKFNQWNAGDDGNILAVTGIFDAQTAAVCQFYLYRQEVDLDYLQMINDKIKKYNGGNKCIHPLSL
jgi:hypothetical protein